LFIDPYNDFLSEGGKLWPRVKDVANEVGLLDNLTAAFSHEMMHAAHELNGPTDAHAILKTSAQLPAA
jgi:hypothetical protein